MSCNCDDEDGVTELTSQQGMPLNYVPRTYGTPILPAPIQARGIVQTPCNSCGQIQCNCYATPNCFTPPNYLVVPEVVPYYNQCGVLVAPEDSLLTTVQTKFVATIKNSASFNMPACGAVAQIVFPGLTQIGLQSEIWAFAVGFLTVTAFDPSTGTVTVRNECTSDTQVAVGTIVAKDTEFTITVPSSAGTGSTGPSVNYPYLAAQFTAPIVNNSIDITVTTTNGLSLNKQVQISGGTYVVDNIASGTTIRIRNAGQGVVAGTVVEAENAGGNYITPVILVDSNPCTGTGVAAGKMLVCNNGISTTLTGLNNQVPVYDAVTGNVSLRSLLIPVGNCTSLTVDFTVDSTLPSLTAYLITVNSTSGFSVAQILNISGVAFIVTQIVSGTQMRVVPTVTPGANQTYNAGVAVCSADCCTQLSSRVDLVEDTLTTNLNAFIAQVNNQVKLYAPAQSIAPNSAPYTLNLGANNLYDGNLAEVVVQNSSVHNMAVVVAINWFWKARTLATDKAWQNIQFIPLKSGALGPIGTTITNPAYGVVETINKTVSYDDLRANPADSFVDQVYSEVNIYILAPGQEYRSSAKGRIYLQNGSSGVQVIADNLKCSVVGIGVAV